MGFLADMFDSMFGGLIGGPEKQVKRHTKRIKHKDAQLEDRQASAIWLYEMARDTEEDEMRTRAIFGLLGRFEMTYEHHMKDAQEKEDVSDFILSLGDLAVPDVALFLRRTKSFAHPLSLYQTLAGEDAARTIVMELLEEEREGSELKPLKKRQLMIKLGDFKHPEIAAHAIPFLQDFDHDVRYATIEVLIAQDEPEDAIRDALIQRLVDPEEDDNRLQGRCAEVILGRGWTLGEHAAAVAADPPQGWTVNGDRLARA